MKLTVHFEGKTKEELINEIRSVADALEGGATVGKTKKAKKEEIEDESNDDDGIGSDDEEDAEESADEEGEESESEEDAEDEEEPKKGKAAKSEAGAGASKKDVVKALQAYSKKFSRDKALAILKSFNVKSVDDLDEADYAKVIKKASK